MLLDAYKPIFSRSFASASTQYLEHAGGVATSFPMSGACWCFPTTETNGTPLSLQDNTVTNHLVSLISSGSGGNNMELHLQAGSTLRSVASAGTYVINRWLHVGFSITSVTSYTVYLDGTGTTGTTSPGGTPTINTTSIGRQGLSTPATYFDGLIAWPAIFPGVALTAADFARLFSGEHPRNIRPDVIMWEFEGTEVEYNDKSFTFPMTNSGTLPQNGPHFLKSPLYSPRRLAAMVNALGAGGNRRRRILMTRAA